jgi:phenylalanyl-tRNA synthetase beta chain
VNASYNWLREFTSFDSSPAELRDLLTQRVTTVDDVVPLRTDLSEIVVGRVVEAGRHPNADHLWVTKVDAGGDTLFDVVCGAPNVEAGRVYPFARVGSTLPGGVKIEKRKIRGETSEGMLCSARELGLGTDHEGILALETEATPGTPLLEAVSLGDTRLVVDVVPSRPDLLSHEGIAREIAAATGAKLRTPSIPKGDAASSPTRPTKGPRISVTVEDREGCPRYAGARIDGVVVGPSPRWLAEKIEAVGGRSINNVVDVSNYMLHGFGQPMHAFDADRISGRKIIVRRARSGESIVTLDGVTRKLDESMTVIADAEWPQAIAGVIGGEGSEVSDSTTAIFLEVASFDPKRVRATRRKLSLSTDASYRFERGVDSDAIPRLLDHAVKMIVAVAGGRVSGEVEDVMQQLPPRLPVRLRIARVASLLGEAVNKADIKRLLRSVGFVVNAAGAGAFSIESPSWRSDVIGEAEAIEEIARLYGYERFSSEIRPFRPGTVPDDPMYLAAQRAQRACVEHGLLEARPMPFVGESSGSSLRVRNPLAEDEAYLRPRVLDSLTKRVEYNFAHMQRDIRLFEIGTIFARSDGSGDLPRERTHLGAVVTGARRPPHFTEPSPPDWDEWDAKGLAESLAESLYADVRLDVAPAEQDLLWSVMSAGKQVGLVREVELDSPPWAGRVWGIEIDLDATAELSVRESYYVPVPTMPAIDVDLALVVPDSTRASDIEASIRRAAGELLEAVSVFDEFRGASVPSGFRSLAWRLTFRHPERTLRDREIQGRTARILSTLESELGIKQRTS